MAQNSLPVPTETHYRPRVLGLLADFYLLAWGCLTGTRAMLGSGETMAAP